MIAWRIYTERKNVDKIIATTNEVFPQQGATFYHGTGLWQGNVEESLIIEFIGLPENESNINFLAHNIKAFNDQQAVLVTATELLNYKLI